jgi:hypothetical protein
MTGMRSTHVRPTPLLRRAPWIAAVAISLLASAASAQDIAVAEALFNSGLADMKAGKYESGCKALAESQRLDPRPGTLFTLASCESQWGHIATAVTRFRDYLALYQALPPDRKAQQGPRPKLAKAEVDKLTHEIPQLTLTLPPDAPPGVVVKRDGDVVASAALGVALPMDPGDHVVSTQLPGGPLWQQTITLTRRDKKSIVLEVKPAGSGGSATSGADGSASSGAGGSGAAEEHAGPGKSGRRVATYVIGGVGLAGLVAGGVLGGVALGKKSTFEKHCGAAIGSPDQTACDRTGIDAVSAARSTGIGSTVAIAVGAAALGTALVLFLTEPRPAKTGSAAKTPWITAGAAPLGADGALVGVGGVW